MVHDETAGAFARARCTRNDDNRRAFRIGARNGIDQVKCAGSVGDHGDAEAAVEARCRIGREPDTGLVAQRKMG